MRLDVIAADRAVAATVTTTWIDHDERGRERPSDHAGLISDFDLTAIAAPPDPRQGAVCKAGESDD
jgi:hypothetical protein